MFLLNSSSKIFLFEQISRQIAATAAGVEHALALKRAHLREHFKAFVLAFFVGPERRVKSGRPVLLHASSVGIKVIVGAVHDGCEILFNQSRHWEPRPRE